MIFEYLLSHNNLGDLQLQSGAFLTSGFNNVNVTYYRKRKGQKWVASGVVMPMRNKLIDNFSCDNASTPT
jgi:hypothetical protein